MHQGVEAPNRPKLRSVGDWCVVLGGNGFFNTSLRSDYRLVSFGCFSRWLKGESWFPDRGKFGIQDASDEVDELCVRVVGLGAFGCHLGVLVVGMCGLVRLVWMFGVPLEGHRSWNRWL